MKTLRLFAAPLAFAALLAGDPSAAEQPTARASTALVAAGTYRPLFPPSPTETTIDVRAFRIDRLPATNGDFLAFVRSHQEWRRDRVAAVLAEPGYLEHWAAADALGDAVDRDQPVVSVSWFAARAYCASRGMRLPTEAEWERAAAASRTSPDGSSDPAWRADILARYSRPSPARLPRVGSEPPNFWGVSDMHGLVWEWVVDFDSAIAAFSSGSDRLRFCGATAGAASDPTDFAAFQRVAFRSSLRASYRTKNLGFRCAADAAPRSAP